METTCHTSYPLNSENESPPGTFSEYLSCAARASATSPERNIATNTVTRILLRFMSNLLAELVLIDCRLASWNCMVSQSPIHPAMRGFSDHALWAIADTTDV